MEGYFTSIAPAAVGIVALFIIVRRFLAIDKTNSPDAFDFEPSVCEDGKLQRPLGMFEKTCQFLSALNDGSGNDITVLIVKSRVSLNPDMVKRALVLVQERYPLLRMRVHGLTSKFKEMKDHFKVDFKTMNYYDPQEWVQAFEEESLIPFDLDQGPLWRVSMLKEHFDGHHYENSLLFSFHHIICDGTSIMALYNTFLQYLNDLQNNNDVDVESMALNPPLAHFIGHKLHSSLLEKCLFKMLPTLIKIKNMLVKPAQNISLATFPPPILQDPSIVKRTSVIPAVLRKDELSQLLMLGKKHGCTFHSVITAATRLAMAQILNTGSVKSKSDMSPHPLYKKSPHKILGTLRENVNALIKKLVQSDDRFKFLKFVGNSDLVKELMSLEDSSICGRYDLAFNISNRGRFAIGEPTDVFQFGGTYFAMAEQTRGPPFCHNVVSVNGDLYWGLVYYPHISTKEQSRRILELSLDILKVAASSME
ncbi:uncharacterized protein LOC114574614 [Exaiptasia diaphana]|uniref:Condensation domain-containing protein n=1 Tax=Exaiptasia diaphana TaxID=2652724 RepID=A0A913YGH4_EXADI|nr:uncharacterized protein LOC114574614 [Exaiptasia diaphana]